MYTTGSSAAKIKDVKLTVLAAITWLLQETCLG